MRKLLLVVIALALSTSALAQTQYRGSVKFVCGKADEEINNFAFSPGIYYTTINVTNQNLESRVVGQKRFSIALARQEPGRFTELFRWVLRPGQAMQIDCSDIYKHLDVSPGKFIDGFVYIVGSPRFDVSAVYTVSDGDRPVSIDVEPVVLR